MPDSMQQDEILAKRFEADRAHLGAVAFRMLGSASEAEDAVQEAWVRLSRVDTSDVENLSGWLTTVVARVCLDMLRMRRSRREEPLERPAPARPFDGPAGPERSGELDPEQEAVLADSVGLALLVVLETLKPAERLAFVLHDMFDVPFDEIAPIVGRSPTAARQLASRARRRVQGRASVSDAAMRHKQEVIEAFLAASRGGNFDALLELLDPDVVLRVDGAAMPSGRPTELQGAVFVARRAAKGGAAAAQPALVNGDVGVVVAPHGRLLMVLDFTVVGGRIVAIDAVADEERLNAMELAVLGL
jgi:RNA polymerase sigma-70 factor (ECF subfamily)